MNQKTKVIFFNIFVKYCNFTNKKCQKNRKTLFLKKYFGNQTKLRITGFKREINISLSKLAVLPLLTADLQQKNS